MTLFTTAISAIDHFPRWSGAALLTCVVAGGLVGCEDSAAQQRVEAQRTITTASTEFRKITAGSVVYGDEHFEQRQRELNGVISRVNNLPDAEPGQQAAGAMLAAEALSELAAMHMAQGKDLQQQNRYDRETLRSVVDAAARLGARASAQAGATVEAQRAALLAERQMTEQGLAMLQQRIAALEGPIQDRQRRNTEEEALANQLRNEANDLVRRAIELGHAAGFPNFQQAIRTRRDADEIDFEIALRELELEYELQPEHQLAQLQVEHLNELVSTIRNTLNEFDQLEQQLGRDLARTQQRVAELAAEARTSLQGLQQRMDGELADQYEAARGYLERAASQARQAVSRLRGDQGNAARLLQAKISETLGQSLWAEANGIAEHLWLLDELIEAADVLGNVAEVQAAHQALTAKRNDLIERAQSAFAEAEQALAGVTGRAASDAEHFRQNLQRAVSAVSGQAIGPAPVASSRGWSDGGTAVAGTGQGFGSPQEALEFLRNMDHGNRAHTARFFNALDTSSPGAAAMIDVLRSIMDEMMDFQGAVVERFGDQLDSAMAMQMSMEYHNVRLTSESADRATIVFDTPLGSDTIELVQRGGQWYIDASELTEIMPGMDQLDPAVMQQMADGMKIAFRDLTRRLRAGEIRTAQELEQAIMSAVMSSMMQGFQ